METNNPMQADTNNPLSLLGSSQFIGECLFQALDSVLRAQKTISPRAIVRVQCSSASRTARALKKRCHVYLAV